MSRLERLRHQLEHRSGMTEWYAIDYGDLEALLAVVGAAQHVALNNAHMNPGATQTRINALKEALMPLVLDEFARPSCASEETDASE